MAMTSQFSEMTSSSIFWRCFVSLVNFSYWSKFHVNITTGFGVMIISCYKGLTKNLEIGEFSPISRDWGELGLPNLARTPLIKCYYIYQRYSFYRFWSIRGIPTGRDKIPRPTTPPAPPKLRLSLLTIIRFLWAMEFVLQFHGNQVKGNWDLELILKMMMLNILLLSFLQWAFVIKLLENQITNCYEKKVSCNSLDSSMLQLTMRYITKYWNVSVQMWS